MIRSENINMTILSIVSSKVVRSCNEVFLNSLIDLEFLVSFGQCRIYAWYFSPYVSLPLTTRSIKAACSPDPCDIRFLVLVLWELVVKTSAGLPLRGQFLANSSIRSLLSVASFLEHRLPSNWDLKKRSQPRMNCCTDAHLGLHASLNAGNLLLKTSQFWFEIWSIYAGFGMGSKDVELNWLRWANVTIALDLPFSNKDLINARKWRIQSSKNIKLLQNPNSNVRNAWTKNSSILYSRCWENLRPAAVLSRLCGGNVARS